MRKSLVLGSFKPYFDAHSTIFWKLNPIRYSLSILFSSPATNTQTKSRDLQAANSYCFSKSQSPVNFAFFSYNSNILVAQVSHEQFFDLCKARCESISNVLPSLISTILLAMSETLYGSTSRPASPTTSGGECLSDVIDGTPHAIHSTNGIPKPS